jgi:hypothetical protein
LRVPAPVKQLLGIDETVCVLFLSHIFSSSLRLGSFSVQSFPNSIPLSAGIKGTEWGSLSPGPARQESEGNVIISYST